MANVDTLAVPAPPRRSRAAVLVIAGAFSACASVPSEPPRAAPSVQASELYAAQTPASVVSVELRAPKRARWVSSTLGPPKPTLGVVVTNHDQTTSIDVSDLRVHLEAIREGVSFRCAASVGASAGAHEPPSLGPGAQFVFDRTLDCMLPLTGRYSVRVSVSFGHGGWSTPHVVDTFSLDVHAPDRVEPKPIAALPGVWGAVGATELVFGETGRGSGRIAVELVNGTQAPLKLPRLRLALRVYRAGSPIPCEDEAIELQTPKVLGPGDAYREPIDVSCLGLGSPGTYEVAARLRVGSRAGVPESELGRLHIEISRDPMRRMSPLP